MDARRAVLQMLDTRASTASLCPSEVARSLAMEKGDNWRDLMPDVHAAVDDLVSDGQIRLSWKGEQLSRRTGPYRIRRHKPD